MAGIGAAAVAVEGGWRALRAKPPGTWSARLDSALLLALIVTSAGGLGIVFGGGGPKESLHYVYSVVAIGALPITSSMTRRFSPRTRGVATLVAALVVVIVVVRLFQTG